MPKYIKIPLEVEAVQWFKMGDHQEVKLTIRPFQYVINTLEGDMQVVPSDWIITGIKGEHYPCKDEIFKLSYQEVVPNLSFSAEDETIIQFPGNNTITII